MSAHDFQIGPGYFAYYNILLVPLVGESFNAYETTTSSLAFSTGKLKNKSLQRKLCHIEVQCIIMVFFLRPASYAAELELSSKWG
jgi:hypothetical protein